MQSRRSFQLKNSLHTSRLEALHQSLIILQAWEISEFLPKKSIWVWILMKVMFKILGHLNIDLYRWRERLKIRNWWRKIISSILVRRCKVLRTWIKLSSIRFGSLISKKERLEEILFASTKSWKIWTIESGPAPICKKRGKKEIRRKLKH